MSIEHLRLDTIDMGDCRHCVFFDYYSETRGFCRVNPPRFQNDISPDGGWPIVAEFEWCGAFRRNPEVAR